MLYFSHGGRIFIRRAYLWGPTLTHPLTRLHVERAELLVYPSICVIAEGRLQKHAQGAHYSPGRPVWQPGEFPSNAGRGRLWTDTEMHSASAEMAY